MKDLQDESGRFYTVTSDSAMFFPVIELACGNVGYVAEKNYIWNLETGINDGLTHR